MSSLAGKIAIVTGGRRGIGEAIALALAEAGADVVVSSQTDDNRLAAVAEAVRKLGRRSLAVKADVSQKAEVDNLVKRTMAEFGRIDILVNGAGLWIPGQSILECEEASWDKVINVDLKGVYLCCRAVAAEMVAQKSGNIINIASKAGVMPHPRAGAYCTAKAGVIMLTRQLALELAEYNIRVNAISPGWVKTDMNVHLRATHEEEIQLATRVVLGRLGEGEDIGKLAVFLASDDSSYITGQSIVADGGGDIPIVTYKTK